MKKNAPFACRLRFVIPLLVACVVSGRPASAQLPTGWRAHDLKRPAPPVVDPGDVKLPANVPSDAVVLFNGTDLSEWCSRDGGPPKWKIVDGAMESVPGSGYLFTKRKWGDCQLHVEWASPAHVKGNGQGRGNSGVFLMGKYEIQVLDSFKNKTYADGSAGSIYGQYPPLVNACRKPGQWQCYDIIFHQPHFDASGKLVSPARMTVLHNGVLIQDNSQLLGPTEWIHHAKYQPHPTELPLSLQDHGNPVRYRNIWIRPLAAERKQPEQPTPAPDQIVTLTDESRQRLVGQYGPYRVKERDKTLFLKFQHVWLEMVPLSETRFAFKESAGHVEFSLDDQGQPIACDISLDAAGHRHGKRK